MTAPRATTAIERIDVFGYDLTYAHGDYVMSSGRVVNRLPSTVVRITTTDGVTGYGECCPLGATYLPGFAEGARAALRELAPALIGADPTNLADITARMDATLRGHDYAKSAIDVACWDVFGRVAGQPVAALLGGVLQRELPLYVAVPLGSPEAMSAFVERARAVHDATGPGEALIADANGGWRRQDAIVAAHLMANLERLRLEQPCPTLEECIAVRRLTTLPMVLDEVITDMTALVRAASLDAMDHINLKIGR